MNDFTITDPPPAVTAAEVLQGALIDSRQRWRELVNLTADFAFETDEWGRFTLIAPDPALYWAAGELLGQPSAMLLAEGGGIFDPFRVSSQVRHRQAWLKRGDGGILCLSFCVAPIVDPIGRIVGVRGLGIDRSECDGEAAGMARALRRAEVLDHMLHRMGREVMASRIMDAALDVLSSAVGAEGIAVIIAATVTDGSRIACCVGIGADEVVPAAEEHLRTMAPVNPEIKPGMELATPRLLTIDGRAVLVGECQTRFNEHAGVVAWRPADARAWDDDECRLIESALYLIRTVLERDTIQQEMALQARTDSLTGLLNRRAFLEEMERHAARQDRDNLPSTLMFADLDNFMPVNDRLGHEVGDDVLRGTAALLRRTFRPTDLIARLGGDEFAIWLNGADHMTAAERAEFLRDAVPRDLAEITGPDQPRLGVSIGIATREPGDGEPLDNLMRRADRAMYEVKRGGRGHWRVSLLSRH